MLKKVEPGMTFQTDHFGICRTFRTVERLKDGAGRPCWLCKTTLPWPDRRDRMTRTEDWVLRVVNGVQAPSLTITIGDRRPPRRVPR